MEPTVSVEVPVFKGRFLVQTIRSVLGQTSDRWRLSLWWDGGDRRSRRVLEAVRRLGNPKITVHFGENRGIGGARRALSERSEGDWILPLDDDDRLVPTTVERFLAEAERRPWAQTLRARRRFIDEKGKPYHHGDVFPFEPHHYELGLVQDVWNFSQPYAFRRSAYERTTGWSGFPDMFGAGEDAALCLELAEICTIELIDAILYEYRMADTRTSLRIGHDGAYEMWRRLADAAIRRTGLFVRRTTEVPPFRYERVSRRRFDLGDAIFVLGCSFGYERRLAQWRAALRAAGVSESAVLAAPSPAAAAWPTGADQTDRAVVALIDVRAEPPERALLDALLRALNEQHVDLVAPKVVSAGGRMLVSQASFDAFGAPLCVGDGTGAGFRWVAPGLVMTRR
jgi:glycosyltransferase involved in cell wall biosynthesis